MILFKLKTLFLINFLFLSCIEDEINFNSSYNHPQIIFSGKHWWNYDILSVDIYGNELSHITRNEWSDSEPISSADGTQLIFATDRDGNREIYSLDIATIEVPNLLPITHLFFFASGKKSSALAPNSVVSVFKQMEQC